MTRKKETCWKCGETIEVRRSVETPHGEKYTLRIGKPRHRWNCEPLPWPLGLPPAAGTTHQRWHRHEPDDFSQRFFRLGLLILLAPFFLLIVLALVTYAPEIAEPDPPNARIIATAQPTDCGFFSGCHYKRHVSHGRDKQGEYIVVTWERVND